MNHLCHRDHHHQKDGKCARSEQMKTREQVGHRCFGNVVDAINKVSFFQVFFHHSSVLTCTWMMLLHLHSCILRRTRKTQN
mmetsp:Transcript_11832/g.16381  ORF Transcript_11832/g.16381 Transcript_11832/m.16381 type:complete len:81 (-) Transcript_11832:16-258(-)